MFLAASCFVTSCAEASLCLKQVAEGVAENDTSKQANVVFLQDMICRYLWSGRQH